MPRRRPPVPDLTFPSTGKPFRSTVVFSLAIHVLLLLLIVWSEVRESQLGTGEPGLAGGGGGGSPQVAYVDISSFVSSPAPVRVQQPAITVPRDLKSIARPAPQIKQWRPVRPVAPTLSRNVGVTGGPGSGAGSGGGKGAGVGTGVGDNIGPGTGGPGAPAYAPEPRSVIYPIAEPPNSLRGELILIHFWVDKRGRVTKVELQPEISDRAYRESFLENMYQWVFYPARMADGTPVEGELIVTHQP